MIALQQEQLFNNIDILPIDLKTKIVDKILSSLTPTKKYIDDTWIKEVNKRKQDIESGNIRLVDGDDVFFNIAQRLKS